MNKLKIAFLVLIVSFFQTTSASAQAYTWAEWRSQGITDGIEWVVRGIYSGNTLVGREIGARNKTSSTVCARAKVIEVTNSHINYNPDEGRMTRGGIEIIIPAGGAVVIAGYQRKFTNTYFSGNFEYIRCD